MLIYVYKLLKLLMGDGSTWCAAAASVSCVHKHHVQSVRQINCLITLDNNRCGWRLILFVLLLLVCIGAQRQRALCKGGIQIPCQLRRHCDACHCHSARNFLLLLLLRQLLLLLGALAMKAIDDAKGSMNGQALDQPDLPFTLATGHHRNEHGQNDNSRE